MKYALVISVTALCSLLVTTSRSQTAASDNKISRSITFHPIPNGPSVLGVFEGRTLCPGIAGQLNITVPADCEKLKWRLTLYRDPATRQPTTYALTIGGAGDLVKQEGGSYRQQVCEGKWTITNGTGSDPGAEVYRLEFGKPIAVLYLLKGDENVLFVLDENRDLKTGNADFSYTLNRVELVPAK